MIGKPGQALMWNKRYFGGDLSVTFKALENSTWYGWTQNPTHEHTAYENIGIALCADGQDVASGYTIIVNGWNLQRSVICRRGRAVAHVVQGEDFPCVYVGGHAPISPRASNVRVLRQGRLLKLLVNGHNVLQYEDPQPLPGGQIGIWCWEAAMNLADVHLQAERSHPQSPMHVVRSLSVKPDTISRFLEPVESAMNLPLPEPAAPEGN